MVFAKNPSYSKIECMVTLIDVDRQTAAMLCNPEGHQSMESVSHFATPFQNPDWTKLVNLDSGFTFNLDAGHLNANIIS
jgi:hypothetical protein